MIIEIIVGIVVAVIIVKNPEPFLGLLGWLFIVAAGTTIVVLSYWAWVAEPEIVEGFATFGVMTLAIAAVWRLLELAGRWLNSR